MIRNGIYLALLTLLSITTFSCNEDVDPEPTDPFNTPDGYSLVWSDEFNGTSINAENWTYETGDGTDYGLPVGWGNSELQIYTTSSDNAGIETDGEASVLRITALSDGAGGYTSAKLTTQNLFSTLFGRVDVRAKLPKGQGIWPAIWMLGDNIDQVDWPGCGEIDIVEVLGHEPSKMYATVHYTNSENKKGEAQGTYELSGTTFNDDYHVFSLDWTPDNMTFYVDGNEVTQITIDADMKEFLRSFYFIMNVAVGGNWPGDPDNSTTFPQSMYVDYIRVFSKDGFTAPTPPALDVDEETIGQVIEPSIAQHAIRDDFTDLGNAIVQIWGGGGEPVVGASNEAIDGDSSLVYNYPGTNWGGGYISLSATVDLSGYNFLKFSIKPPATLADAEIKLESPVTNAAVFLVNYTGTDVGQGFVEYTIPLSDFGGLDLSAVRIPFSMWNPKDGAQNFMTGTVLIDNLHFSN